MASKDRAELLRRVREKMLSKKGGRKRDPNEFRAPQVQNGQKAKFKAYVLPPTDAMDELWFYQVGDHWVQEGSGKKRYPCPRVYDGDQCAFCQVGFDLLNETDDKDTRSKISRAYLPRTQYVVNVYFSNEIVNPEELRGQVKFYAMPKTIFDKLEECLIRDDGGDDPDKPDPWGIFYEPTEAYPLSIQVTRKGDFNSYVESELIATAQRAIGTDEEIEAILEKRHDIPSKYPERSRENRKILDNLADAALNGGESSDNDNDGFDSDETIKESKPAPKAKAKPKDKPKPVPAATPEVEVEVEDEELQKLLDSIKNES